MKPNLKKTLICVLTALVLSGIFSKLIAYYAEERSRKRIMYQIETGLKNAESVIESMYDNDTAIAGDFTRFNDISMEIVTTMLKEKVIDGEYTGKRVFSDGLVVKVHDGVIEMPDVGNLIVPELTLEDFKDDLPLTTRTVYDEYGAETYYFINTSNIGGDYYYVDVLNYDN